MTPERWQQTEALLHRVLERQRDERAAFLMEACAGDEALRQDVESLLKAHQEAGGFMESPALEVAAKAMAEGHARLLAGREIGHFKMVSLLGSGGMGEVYLAEDSKLGRKVALKLLPAEFTQDKDRVGRFKQEARAASALNHPNIITVYEIVETGGANFIVTEFIDGQTLRQQLARGPMKLADAIEIATQAAAALDAAHNAGIVHRDIKPENIMVRRDGLVKVLDFGLAKLTAHRLQAGHGDAPTVTTTGTVPGMVMGTLRYVSPEQARGLEVDARTDIFSLGIVLFEMVSGQLPFQGATAFEILAAILHQEPAPLARYAPGIPDELERIVGRALRKNRDARYQSAQDLLLDLQSLTRPMGPTLISPAIVSGRHMVGRRQERTELHAGFASAVSGRGLLLCVSGEPGIGKTTLVEEFLSELSSTNPAWLIARGRCSERLAGTASYLPWLEALESLLGAGENVAQMMKRLAPAWYAQVAPVERLLTEAERASSPERMKRELGALLQEISRGQPLVVFFDDLHWADASTIDLLAFLADRFQGVRLLIVVAYRPSDLSLARHPFLQLKPDLQARGVCHEIQLEFLNREEIEKYLALEFPEHRFPNKLPHLIHAKTEGSPLFMADLVRYLRDREVITREQDHWTLVESLPEIERDLPESVRAMIERKIAQLDEEDRRLLVAASVQGYEFDSAVVTRVLELDAAEVEERLEALERVHSFVRLASEQELPDRTLTLRYRFIHVLYQNALYASLRPTRKASLSTAVAEALLGYYGKQASPIASELAMLFEAARNFERAAEYFLVAAQHAAHLSANKEAVVLARRGLEALMLMPERPERAQQELRLQTTLGPALMATMGIGAPAVETVYKRAQTLCQQVGNTPQLFTVIFGLYQYFMARGKYQTCRELSEQLLALSQKLQDPALLLLAHNSLGNTCWVCGDFTPTVTHCEQAIAIYVPEQHHSLAAIYSGWDPGVACRCGLAVNLWLLGYPDQAVQRGHEAITLARDISHNYSVVFAMVFNAMLHQNRRDAQRTRQEAEAAIALATEQELASWLPWATVLLGWALTEQGQAEEGIAQLRQAIAGWRAGGGGALTPYFLALLADAYAKKGQAEEGLATIAEALAITEQTGEGYVEAEIHRLKGELLLMQTSHAEREAEACFRQALEIARRQRAKSLELRAVMSLCRLYRQTDKRAEARAMLTDVYGWFTEGLDTSDLKEARVLLA